MTKDEERCDIDRFDPASKSPIAGPGARELGACADHLTLLDRLDRTGRANRRPFFFLCCILRWSTPEVCGLPTVGVPSLEVSRGPRLSGSKRLHVTPCCSLTSVVRAWRQLPAAASRRAVHGANTTRALHPVLEHSSTICAAHPLSSTTRVWRRVSTSHHHVQNRTLAHPRVRSRLPTESTATD